jgi:DNA-binding NarL/FixJ family response regulator
MPNPGPTAVDSIGVLICDDSDALRQLLRIAVNLDGELHVAGEARDGQEAIGQAELLQPDVILLDLSMPVRTGLDALPRIRSVAPAAQVIVLTGLSGSIVKAACLDAGAHGFLEKGSKLDTITETIKGVYADGRHGLLERQTISASPGQFGHV